MASITFTIPDNQVADFLNAFLRIIPVPTDESGMPLFTTTAWLKEWGRQQYLRAYRKGKTEIAQESNQPVIDSNIIS